MPILLLWLLLHVDILFKPTDLLRSTDVLQLIRNLFIPIRSPRIRCSQFHTGLLKWRAVQTVGESIESSADQASRYPIDTDPQFHDGIASAVWDELLFWRFMTLVEIVQFG